MASGRALHWINVRTGKIEASYPQGAAREDAGNSGFGRGFITPSRVYWPTKFAVVVLPLEPPTKGPLAPLHVIDLKTRGATGGNLLPVPGGLLIAGADRLQCWDAREPR
jgi:hypothetical protein